MTKCALLVLLGFATSVAEARETNVIVNHITDRRTFYREGVIEAPAVEQEDHAHPENEPVNATVIAVAVEEVPHSCPSRLANFLLGGICTIVMLVLAGKTGAPPVGGEPGS